MNQLMFRSHYLYLVLALGVMCSCNSTFFKTANEMRGIQGQIVLRNGKELEGKIRTKVNFSKLEKNYVEITSEKEKTTRYNMEDIASMTVRNNTYVPKILQAGSWGMDQARFVKVISPAGAKIKLYEYLTISSNTATVGGVVSSYDQTNFAYYVSMPGDGDLECTNIENRRFVPDFDEKVADLVKKCKPLSKKIKSKDKDYYYPLIVSNDRRINVWLNIINEYDHCNE